MCRIAGIISAGTDPDQIKAAVSVMCHTLQHGGPDDEGIFSDNEKGLVFGHRRLSLIDLTSGGHQPMADVTKKAWITFNGEIYNYRELKEELIKLGAQFHSNSDTEVIVQAYLYWGTASFVKLQGMFAFALFDTTKSVTYLVRDSSGIKPLYYHIQNQQLSFASEIKALKQAGVATQPDENWRIRFLAYGHVPEPYTTLKNVFSLPKGHFLKWDNKDSTFIISAYTQTYNTSLVYNAHQAQEYIHHALKAAVNRQLVADAPLGVFLSGGIDSSIITLLANQHHQNLKTVSIYFDEGAYDERGYQNAVASQIQGEKFAHLVKQADFDTYLPQIIKAMDMPTTDGINSWFISKYAHEDGLKAVLSGIGADELFGGYPSFKRIKNLKYLKMLPKPLLGATRHFKADRYKKLFYLRYDHYLADYLLLRGIFVPDDIAKILDTDVKEVDEVLFDGTYPTVTKYDEQLASDYETNLYMQNQLLRDTDVMSMSHGLEVRVPFLDEEFKKVVESISSQIRFENNPAKKLLIDSFKELLPETVWNRPKMGFSFPLQQWMKQHNEISNENLYTNTTIKSIIKQFKNGGVHWSKAFMLYQLTKHE
ncbi:MAG: asparagine synthase (glutamine-hydrolyzing) [Sphingobacteriaceae bacterium]|nr:MAG: asparagine synthase (glutamine-hydrolyzing) [Sphingobacteriaceae bacterium]